MISLRWFGQACFEIKNSVTIVTDPHDGDSVNLKPPSTKGDIITISHHHYDHKDGKKLVSKRDAETIHGIGQRKAKGVEIEGIESFHDKAEGRKRGKNTIFVLELDGFRICHLGDLGHELSDEKAGRIKPVDILLIPVGGHYTIDAQEAVNVTEAINPKIVIPMHYKVGDLNVDISSEEEFIKLARDEGWKVVESDEAQIENLPGKRRVIKLTCQAL